MARYGQQGTNECPGAEYIDGVVSLPLHGTEVTMTGGDGSAGGGDTEEIAIGSDTWVSGVAISKPWLHIHSATGGPLASFNQLDPSQILSLLTREGVALRLIGNDTVRGVATQHYYLVPAPAPVPSSPFRIGNVRQEIWIDAGHLVRRFRASGTVSPASGPEESVEWTMEFYNFGLPARIEPPPADQVMENPTIPPCSPPPTDFVCAGTTFVPSTGPGKHQ